MIEAKVEGGDDKIGIVVEIDKVVSPIGSVGLDFHVTRSLEILHSR